MNHRSLKVTHFFLIFVLWYTCTKSENYARALTSSIYCSEDCSTIIDSLFDSKSISKLFATEVSPSDTVINFGDYVGYQENSTILLKDNFETEKGTYLIRIGSDDGFRLFINNKLFGQNLNKRGLHPDTDWIVAELQSGMNELIFQVDQSDGSWGLHYNIEPLKKEKLKNLILEYIPEIYSDLPEACILPDSGMFLQLKLDIRVKHDRFHTLRYRWVDLLNVTQSEWIYYKANSFPDHVPISENFDGFKLFDYELIDANKNILYKESIPIFTESMAEQKAMEFKNKLQDIKHETYLENLELQYPTLFGLSNELDYSTRHKAEFLLDLILFDNEASSFTGGPRTELFNGKLFRTYSPYKLSDPKDLIIGFHVELEDSVDQYFNTYAGKSHAKMVEWNSYIQASGNTLIMPFIKPIDKELSISAFNEHYLASIEIEKHKKIKAISWSKGVPMLLNEFSLRSLPIDEAHMISSWLMISEQEAFRTANLIRRYNPDIEFNFWHGRIDTDVPYSYVKSWTETFQNQNINSTLVVEPNSTHWSHFLSMEKKIIN